MILYGALTTLDKGEPVGVALAIQAPDRKALDALLDDEQLGLDAGAEIEIHNWELGGDADTPRGSGGNPLLDFAPCLVVMPQRRPQD